MDTTYDMAVVSRNKGNICEFMFSHIFHLVFSLLREKSRGLKMVGCILIVALTSDCFGLQSTVISFCLDYFLAPYFTKRSASTQWELASRKGRQCDEHIEIYPYIERFKKYF